jgi:hypothetical protein
MWAIKISITLSFKISEYATLNYFQFEYHSVFWYFLFKAFLYDFLIFWKFGFDFVSLGVVLIFLFYLLNKKSYGIFGLLRFHCNWPYMKIVSRTFLEIYLKKYCLLTDLFFGCHIDFVPLFEVLIHFWPFKQK